MDYVNQCDSLGWRPVFTTAQYLVIARELGAEQACTDTDTYGVLYGVVFRVGDTTRPPMPEEPLADPRVQADLMYRR